MNPAPHSLRFEHLQHADLEIGTVYRSGDAGNVSDHPIARLVGGGNSGGIRFGGTLDPFGVRFLVPYTTLADDLWPDAFDDAGQRFIYYGDNKTLWRNPLCRGSWRTVSLTNAAQSADSERIVTHSPVQHAVAIRADHSQVVDLSHAFLPARSKRSFVVGFDVPGSQVPIDRFEVEATRLAIQPAVLADERIFGKSNERLVSLPLQVNAKQTPSFAEPRAVVGVCPAPAIRGLCHTPFEDCSHICGWHRTRRNQLDSLRCVAVPSCHRGRVGRSNSSANRVSQIRQLRNRVQWQRELVFRKLHAPLARRKVGNGLACKPYVEQRRTALGQPLKENLDQVLIVRVGLSTYRSRSSASVHSDAHSVCLERQVEVRSKLAFTTQVLRSHSSSTTLRPSCRNRPSRSIRDTRLTAEVGHATRPAL